MTCGGVTGGGLTRRHQVRGELRTLAFFNASFRVVSTDHMLVSSTVHAPVVYEDDLAVRVLDRNGYIAERARFGGVGGRHVEVCAVDGEYGARCARGGLDPVHEWRLLDTLVAWRGVVVCCGVVLWLNFRFILPKC